MSAAEGAVAAAPPRFLDRQPDGRARAGGGSSAVGEHQAGGDTAGSGVPAGRDDQWDAGQAVGSGGGSVHRAVPDCAYLHAERRKPGVTLELLHLEYLEQHPDGYRYTQFCEFYRRWLPAPRAVDAPGPSRRREVLRRLRRQEAVASSTPATGEVIAVELFVAVLGASNYTYAEATRTQQVPDWIASHQRAFQFFGGVTDGRRPRPAQERRRRPVPLRARAAADLRGVRPALRHRDPARRGPAKPRDKAKVEVGRASRRAVDPRAPAPRDLLLARRAQRAHRRAARAS